MTSSAEHNIYRAFRGVMEQVESTIRFWPIAWRVKLELRVLSGVQELFSKDDDSLSPACKGGIHYMTDDRGREFDFCPDCGKPLKKGW